MSDAMKLGEALVGDGDEVAHVDLVLGPKDGPAGTAFANALARQSEGHNSLLAVVEPNLPAKPDTVMFNKVTIKGEKQATQMFGPAQAAVARAVVDSVEDGTIPRRRVDDLCIVAGVFIHWEAEDNQAIYDYNYDATKLAVERAIAEEPKADEVISGKTQARHPFAGGTEGP